MKRCSCPLPRPNARLRGGAVVNLLILVAGSVAILGLIIYYQKHVADERAVTPPVAANPAQTAPLRPNTPPRAPEHKQAKVAKPVEPAFIGDAAYKVYHRPDCKQVKTIAPANRVAFASAEEAFARGFIPCKICRPETPAETAKAPTTQTVSGFIADLDRKRYHRPDCPHVAAIAPGRSVLFKSPADAFANGFLPCRSCNPDLPDLLSALPAPTPPAPEPAPEKTGAGKTVRPPTTGAVSAASLSDRDKKELYKSLFALKGMLKGISPEYRPYEVLSDRYHVSTATVEAVEREGDSKHWPKQ